MRSIGPETLSSSDALILTLLATLHARFHALVLQAPDQPFHRSVLKLPGREVPALGQRVEHVIERDILERAGVA